MIKESYQSNDGKWHGTQFSYKGLEPNRVKETGRWIQEDGEVKLGPRLFLTRYKSLESLSRPMIKPEKLKAI